MHSSQSFDLRCSTWLEDNRRKRPRLESAQTVLQIGNSFDFHFIDSGFPTSENVRNIDSDVSNLDYSSSSSSSTVISLKYCYTDSNFGDFTSSSPSSTASMSPFSIAFPSPASTAHRVETAVRSREAHTLDSSSIINPPEYLRSSSYTRMTKPQSASDSLALNETSACRGRIKKSFNGPSQNCGFALHSSDFRQDKGPVAASLGAYPHQKQRKTFSKDSGCSVTSIACLSYNARKDITSINESYASSVRTKKTSSSPFNQADRGSTIQLPDFQRKAMITHRMKEASVANRNMGQSVTEEKDLTTARKKTDTEGQICHLETSLHNSSQGVSRRKNSLMSGIALVQKWIKVGGTSRQKSVDRRLSLASTSASTSSTFHDRSIDWGLLSQGGNSDDRKEKHSPTWENTFSISEVKQCGVIGLTSSTNIVTHRCDDKVAPTKNKPVSNEETSLSSRGAQSVVFPPKERLDDCRGHQDEVPGRENGKDMSVERRHYMTNNNLEVNKPKHDFGSRIGQRGLTVGGHRSAVNCSAAEATKFNKEESAANKNVHAEGKVKSTSQIQGLSVPYSISQQRIVFSNAYSNCHGLGNTHHCSSATLNCFIKTKAEDGTSCDIWLCRNRGDFKPFLESSNFETRLGRNFLRLAHVQDRLADRIAYKTLTMLRACRYAPSDILQCVALALCHIRRAASRIIVRNSTEAAYVLCLQVFLAHVWLMDETCPIKEWHKHIFVAFCPFDCLNKAMMCLFEAQGTLSVEPELVHSAVHDLASSF